MPKKAPSKPASTAKQLPDAALELIAHRFRALSEPVRLKLLSALMQGEKNVTQLVEAAGTGQANVSKHLAILKQAGMITTKREGLATLCSIGGMLCLFAWRTARTLSRNHLVPVRDPRLGESIAFQNI